MKEQKVRVEVTIKDGEIEIKILAEKKMIEEFIEQLKEAEMMGEITIEKLEIE